MPRTLQYDRTLLWAVLFLTFFGVLMVFSATTGGSDGSIKPLIKQSVAVLIGLAAMRLLMFFDYHKLNTQLIVFVAIGVSVVLLTLALIYGTGNNTRRFLRVWELSIQPSELSKLAMILFLAYYLAEKCRELESKRTLGLCALVVGALAILIAAGRDLGTAACVAMIAAIVLWVAGLRFRYFVWAGLVASPAVAAAVIAEPFRVKRLMSFWDPWKDPLGAGFQIIQSQIAVSTGGVMGKGLMEGRQKMRFLPEPHTDFIFAVISEELGLIGALGLVLIFGVLLWRGARVAARAPDRFGCYLAVGVTAMLACQAAINMGVVLALLPTKGLPLPFISYGGTAMITSLAGVGVLLNVSQHAD